MKDENKSLTPDQIEMFASLSEDQEDASKRCGIDLRDLLEYLTDRQRQVIDFRYGLSDGRHRSLRELGKLLGVSATTIKKFEARALSKLKRILHTLAPEAGYDEINKQLEVLGIHETGEEATTEV